jgi:hypothetical protein
MPIVPSDVQFYLSAPTQTTAGTVGQSWGGFVSTTQLSSTPLNNLFTDITGAMNAASQVDYACLFILNNTGGGLSMLNTVVWLPVSGDVAGGATVSIASDPTAASVASSSSPQSVTIVSATTAPSGVSSYVSDVSSAPTAPSYTGGLQLGTIPAGYVKAIWVRRTAHNTTALNNDGFQVEVDFDTAA